MSCTELAQQLKRLQLHGMAQAWDELRAERSRQPASPEAWLSRMLAAELAELAERQVRSLRYQLRTAAGSWRPKAPRRPSSGTRRSRASRRG